MTEDSMHRTLREALARNAGLAERVAALADEWIAADDTTQWGDHTRSRCGHKLRALLDTPPVPPPPSVGGPSAEDVEALADPTLTVADVNALTGDDIESWLTNPFMSPDMLAEKVCWWVTVAEARGAERGARAVVEAVEKAGWDSTRAAAREAAARVGGDRPYCLRCEVPIYQDERGVWRREATGVADCPRNPARDGHEPLARVGGGA